MFCRQENKLKTKGFQWTRLAICNIVIFYKFTFCVCHGKEAHNYVIFTSSKRWRKVQSEIYQKKIIWNWSIRKYISHQHIDWCNTSKVLYIYRNYNVQLVRHVYYTCCYYYYIISHYMENIRFNINSYHSHYPV